MVAFVIANCSFLSRANLEISCTHSSSDFPEAFNSSYFLYSIYKSNNI
jgi:hypothetical protein